MDIEKIKEKFRITGDYHTHTIYSKTGPYAHGKGKVVENVAAAVGKGLKAIAITDHGPSDFYILLGVEADIVDTTNGLDITDEEFGLFDFVNAGYHYVPNCHMISNFLAFRFPCRKSTAERLRKENTDRIIKALTCNNIYILTHPGDKAYIDVHRVAKACEETDTLVEINARHRHPDCEELKVFEGYDVRFVISSDAHKPEKVGRYVRSMQLALSAGIGPERIVNIEEIRK